MTTHQSSFAKFKQSPPRALTAGALTTAIFDYTFADAYTAASDILELGMLPAGAQLVGASIVTTTGLDTTTADIGIMDGEFGDAVTARALTSDLIWDDLNVDGTDADATNAACLNIAPDHNNHRSIGMKLSANVAAGSERVRLRIDYVF